MTEEKPHPLKGRKQSPEHVAARVASRKKNGTSRGWKVAPEKSAKYGDEVKRRWANGVYSDRPPRPWTEEQKAAASAKRKQMWAEGRYADKKPANRRAVSVMERSLKPYLEALGYQHTEDRQCFIACTDKTRAPDYVDFEGRRVFEFFGNFWHHPNEEPHVIERYAEKGWECTVLWEEDLRDWLDAHRDLVTQETHEVARSTSRDKKRYPNRGNAKIEFQPI